MGKLNDTDRDHLQERIRFLRGEIKKQQVQKKDQRDQGYIDQCKAAIDVISQWMDGVNVVEKDLTVPEKPFTKAEFKEAMKAMGLDTSKPGAVMLISSKKEIDQMWPWLKTANIEVRLPHELVAYWKQKLSKERPYQAISQ